MIRVLVAGIGGASLGTEVGKCLKAAGGYTVFGCDISPLAFGHYDGIFVETSVVDRENYISDLLALCRRHHIAVLIPGGDQPARLIAAAASRFIEVGTMLAMNDPDVISRLADKSNCFRELARLGFSIPITVELDSEDAVTRAPLPCIVKPSIESGGSAFVFFVRTRYDLQMYARYLSAQQLQPLAQEYVPHDHGEFTVGVLSALDATVVGAIAMKRAFPAKLSIAARGADFLISSGYSQGHIDAYPDVCAKACEIARAVGSRGPLNIQGRVDGSGRFLPFEINPRFSASTYLRTLAGFNEVDWFLRHLLGAEAAPDLRILSGWYLRSLSEVAVPDGDART